MLRMSSSTISTFLPSSERRRGRCSAARACVACASGSGRGDAVQEERRLVEQPLVERDGSCAIDRLHAAGVSARLVLLDAVARARRRRSAASRRAGSPASVSTSVEPRHVREARIDDDAVERSLASASSASCGRSPTAVVWTSPLPIDLDNGRRVRRVVARTSSRFFTGRSTKSRSSRERVVQRRRVRAASASTRGAPAIEAALAAPRRSRSRGPGCGAWRGRSFSRSSTRQPSMSGRRMSSVIASGLKLARQRQAAAPRRRDRRP